MPSRVLLTGANGFIGSHILAQLLDRGFEVCCTVRSQTKGDGILNNFASQKSQIYISIVPDIVAPGAYDHVLDTSPSLETVIHTASPFGASNAASNLEFLDPAIKGTTGLLRSVKTHAPNIKRVVFTSSSAAVVDYDSLTSNPSKILTEADWNPITWEDAVAGDPSKAYRASKKFAELAAWDFVKQERPNFDLVTLCPPATFGPLRHSIANIADLNESNARLWKLCFQSRRDAPVPYIPVHTYVDVRDLAIAHVQAMLVPQAGNSRFLVSARQFGFQDICDILRAHFVELENRTPLGKPDTSSLPAGAYTCDNTRVRSILGVNFRSLEETTVDVAKQLLEIERNQKGSEEGSTESSTT